jgi:hypothetical protein
LNSHLPPPQPQQPADGAASQADQGQYRDVRS